MTKDRHRLLEQAVQAQAARSGAEDPQQPRQPGDVFSLPATAERTVLWAWIEIESDDLGDRAVLVAADLHPWVGSADVAAPPEASCGALALRCGFEVEMPIAALQDVSGAGRLPPQTLQSARLKRNQLGDGTLHGSRSERDTDEDPEYQGWLEEGPRRARALLQQERGAQPRFLMSDALDAVSGVPWMPFTEARHVVANSLDEAVDPGLLQLLQHAHRSASQPHLGADAGVVDHASMSRGWGLVLASDEPAETLTALQPLIDHRRRQLGDDRVKILDHRPGEEWRGWLARHGVAPGHADHTKVPFYVLIVAPPKRISFDFQRILGVEYGVGRLSFETPDDLARYAQGLVSREIHPATSTMHRAVVFAPSTVRPADGPLDLDIGSSEDGWQVQRLEGEKATKDLLLEAMQGQGQAPLSLLVAVTQGLVGTSEAPGPRDLEGALLCHRDVSTGAVESAHRLAASDVGAMRVAGSVLLLLAAHSAGTPSDRTGLEPSAAALPQRLLAHPEGGADAVIGRIGPGWRQEESSPEPWQDLLGDLTAGRPVGLALQRLRTRYAALATELAAELDKVQMGARHEASRLAGLWGERNNLRDLVVLGDPAARITPQTVDLSKSESSQHGR